MRRKRKPNEPGDLRGRLQRITEARRLARRGEKCGTCRAGTVARATAELLAAIVEKPDDHRGGELQDVDEASGAKEAGIGYGAWLAHLHAHEGPAHLRWRNRRG